MLKPCKYRFRTNDPNIFRCITDKLIHMDDDKEEREAEQYEAYRDELYS